MSDSFIGRIDNVKTFKTLLQDKNIKPLENLKIISVSGPGGINKRIF